MQSRQMRIGSCGKRALPPTPSWLAYPRIPKKSTCPGSLRASGGAALLGHLAEAQAQKGGDGRLLRLHAMDVFFQIALRLVGEPFQQRAVHVAVEDGGMDVAAAADRRRVAEMRGHLFDGVDDRLFALRFAVEMLELAQRLGREVRRGPGTEILGGDVLAGDLAQVRVDVV